MDASVVAIVVAIVSAVYAVSSVSELDGPHTALNNNRNEISLFA